MSGLIDKAVNIVDRALIQGADADMAINPDSTNGQDEPIDQPP